MQKIVKAILIVLGIGFLNTSALAQDGIDTALFKQYKVKKMWVWIKLPILPNRTLNDSCKVEVYELDTFERITYQHNIMSCYGWDNSTENFNTYDSLNRVIFTKRRSKGTETIIRYYYNSKNDPIKIVHKNPLQSDSLVIINKFTYNKKGKAIELKTFEIGGPDTTKFIIKYEYDKADNVNILWTYTGDMQLIQKQTFDITPISKKLLEFTTETKLPKETFTKGFNYYNFDAQLSRTQYSNNTWTEFVYKENGLLDEALSYNMQGKLNSWKRYYYEFYEGDK